MTMKLRKDSQIPAYMAYPRFLLTMDISETAKLIYVLLLDRARLSMKNEGWEDEQGHVFIYYTIADLASASGRSEMTVKNALAALEQKNLISRKRQGAGLPSKIYVQVQTETCLTGWTSFKPQTDQKLSTSNKQRKEAASSEAPHGGSGGTEPEEGAKPQNPAADPGRCDFGERISPGTAHGTGSAESDSGEATGYERYE